MADPSQPTRARDVLRDIPLSRIVVPDGFNPRREIVRDAQFRATVETMRERGCLQPIRVRTTDTGDYALISGARRYFAAVEASLTELPAIVRAAGSGDAAEEADLLVDAMIENEHRVGLDPVERALGYRRMLDGGLTVKGVAQRLGGISERRIREHLRILDLPESLWPQVADATIPLTAVRPLAQLAKAHAGLPAVAVKRVLSEPPVPWGRDITWSDVAHDAVAVVAGQYDDQATELPDDVFVGGVAYRLARFQLSEQATKDAEKLCRLREVTPEQLTVSFGRELLDQAASLNGALVSVDEWAKLVIGQEVADQLVADELARQLKAERARVRRERAAQRDQDDTSTSDEPSEEDRKAAERERRAEQKAAREAAVAHNQALGPAVLQRFAKVRLDAGVLKILTACALQSDLGAMAMRGARYGFPGWVTETPRANGRETKLEYPSRADAERKAHEFLAGATSAGEIAGRTLALLAMARLADERAVPAPQRTLADVRFGSALPWSSDAAELLEELLVERLPDHLVEPLVRERAEREARRAEDERRTRKREAAVAQLRDEVPQLGRDARKARIDAVRQEHGFAAVPWSLSDELLGLPEPAPEAEVA